MTTALDRHYPVAVVARILSDHFRLTPDDGELYSHAQRCIYNAFDTAETMTNRVIVPTTVRIGYDDIEDSVIELPTAPISEIVGVKYVGEDGEWHTIEPSAYTFVGDEGRAVLELASMPTLSSARRTHRFEIIAKAGYADTDMLGVSSEGYPLPGNVEQAVKLMAGTFFDYQADTVAGSTSEIPTCARMLLTPLRFYPYGR